MVLQARQDSRTILSRINTPATIEASPTGSQPLLEVVTKQFGLVPNLFRIVGNSSAGPERYRGLNGALRRGAIDAKTRGHVGTADLDMVRAAGFTDVQIV